MVSAVESEAKVVEITIEHIGTLKNTLTPPLLSSEGYRYLPPVKKAEPK